MLFHVMMHLFANTCSEAIVLWEVPIVVFFLPLDIVLRIL